MTNNASIHNPLWNVSANFMDLVFPVYPGVQDTLESHFVYLRKGTQSLETRAHMTNLTRSVLLRSIANHFNFFFLGINCFMIS